MDGPAWIGESLSHHHIVQFLSSASIPLYAYLGAVPVDDLVDPGPEPVD